MIYVRAKNQGAQGTHQESHAESHQRQHQRSEFMAGGEEGSRDVGGVVTEHLKIVGFQKVAASHAQDWPELGSGHDTRSTRQLMILCAVLQVFIYLAALHDEHRASRRGHILERIAVKR